MVFCYVQKNGDCCGDYIDLCVNVPSDDGGVIPGGSCVDHCDSLVGEDQGTFCYCAAFCTTNGKQDEFRRLSVLNIACANSLIETY